MPLRRVNRPKHPAERIDTWAGPRLEEFYGGEPTPKPVVEERPAIVERKGDVQRAADYSYDVLKKTDSAWFIHQLRKMIMQDLKIEHITNDNLKAILRRDERFEIVPNSMPTLVKLKEGTGKDEHGVQKQPVTPKPSQVIPQPNDYKQVFKDLYAKGYGVNDAEYAQQDTPEKAVAWAWETWGDGDLVAVQMPNGKWVGFHSGLEPEEE